MDRMIRYNARFILFGSRLTAVASTIKEYDMDRMNHYMSWD